MHQRRDSKYETGDIEKSLGEMEQHRFTQLSVIEKLTIRRYYSKGKKYLILDKVGDKWSSPRRSMQLSSNCKLRVI